MEPIDRLLEARHHDPFALLGLHADADGPLLRVLRPHAEKVEWLDGTRAAALTRVDARGLFEWHGEKPPERPWRLAITEDGERFEITDPYAFDALLGDDELHLFGEGRLLEAYRTLGGRAATHQGVAGARFAVWAPNAERVSVVGAFNRWDGRVHMMRSRGGTGVWELFIPGLQAGDLYKYEIRNRASGEIRVKTDPYAQRFETRPGTASMVVAASEYAWRDDAWLAERARRDWLHAPMNEIGRASCRERVS
jgi:1,4-alpha-glucan branching enzyme